MHTFDRIDRVAQARHLEEALLARLAKGREWATPGVEAALRRALTGLDTGLDTASPRLQASLRTIADELAGRVETATPRLHERIARLIPEADVPVPAVSPPRTAGKLWWYILAALTAAAGGLVLWRMVRPVPEPEVEPGTGAAPAPEVVPTGETSVPPPIQTLI